MCFKEYLFHLLQVTTVLFILCIAGCEYHTDKEYVSTVHKPENANISLNLDPSDSIIYLAGIKSFNYQTIVDSLKFYNVTVFVDTTKIIEKDEKTGSFTLNANDYPDGHYTLKIVATTGTGSGSLADILGGEGFLFSFSWDIIVDKTPPSAVQITNIYNSDGILKLEWEKYSKGNFGWYEVVKTIFNSYGTPISSSVANIYNCNENYFFDNTYVGGKVQYQVRVLTPMYKNATSEAKTFIDEGFILKAKWIENDLVKLSWTRCKYPKALKEYRIYQNQQLIYSSTQADSNQIIKHIGIFGGCKYELIILSKGGDSWGWKYSDLDHAIGIPMMKYQKFFHSQSSESVYLTTEHKLYRFNTVTREISDSASLLYPYPDFLLSPDGKLMFYHNPQLKINPQNLAESSPVNGVLYNCLYSLSSNYQGLVNTGVNMALYDFVTSKIISQFSGPILTYDFYITEDAKYVLGVNRFESSLNCYILEGNQMRKIWQNHIDRFILIPGEPDKVLILNNKTCEIRNVTTNQVLKSFSVDSFWISGIDPDSKTVMFHSSVLYNRAIVYNYQTGQLIMDFEVSTSSFGYSYYRGAIYSPNGYVLPLVNLKK